MMNIKSVVIGSVLVATCAFLPSPQYKYVVRPETAVLVSSRRHILENAAFLGGGLLVSGRAAVASGGATAGGAYLLSAKQRYNDRVKATLKGFVGLQKSVESGSMDDVKAYFVSEEAGAWADGSSAGYLLANAFRRNSSAAPDTLPSVKKWKAFAAAVESFMKSAKKNKDPAATLDSYRAALAAMEGYLVEVDLPPVSEL